MIKKRFRRWTLFIVIPLFLVGWIFLLSYISLISFACNYFDYVPRKFTVIEIGKIESRRKTTGFTYLKGTIDGVEENYTPGDKDIIINLVGLQGKVLDVLYNKSMTETFVQGQTLRVIDGSTTFTSLIKIISILTFLIYFPITLILVFLYNKSIILYVHHDTNLKLNSFN